MKSTPSSLCRVLANESGGTAVEWGSMLAVVLAISAGLYLMGQAGRARLGAMPAVAGDVSVGADRRVLADASRDLADSFARNRTQSGKSEPTAASCRDIVVPFFGVIQASKFSKCAVAEFFDNDELQYFGDILGTTDAQLVELLSHITLQGARVFVIDIAPRVLGAAPGLLSQALSWVSANSPQHVAAVLFDAALIQPIASVVGMVSGTIGNGKDIVAAWNEGDGKRAGRAVRSIASGVPEALVFLLFDAKDYADLAHLAYHGGGDFLGKAVLRNAPDVLAATFPIAAGRAARIDHRIAAVIEELGVRGEHARALGPNASAIRQAQQVLRESTALRAAMSTLDGEAAQTRFVAEYADEIARGAVPRGAAQVASRKLDEPTRTRLMAFHDMDPEIQTARRTITWLADEARNDGKSVVAYEQALVSLEYPGLAEGLVGWTQPSRDVFLERYAANARRGVAEAVRRALAGENAEMVVGFLDRYRRAIPSIAPWATAEKGRLLPLDPVLVRTRIVLDQASSNATLRAPFVGTRALLGDNAVLAGLHAVGAYSRARLLTELADAAALGPDEALYRAVSALSPDNQGRFLDAHWLSQLVDERRTAIASAGHPQTANILDDAALRDAIGTLDHSTRARFFDALAEHAALGPDKALDRAMSTIPEGTVHDAFQDARFVTKEIRNAQERLGRFAARYTSIADTDAFVDAVRTVEEPALRAMLSRMPPPNRGQFLDSFVTNASLGSKTPLEDAFEAAVPIGGNSTRRAFARNTAADLMSVLPAASPDNNLANATVTRALPNEKALSLLQARVDQARNFILNHPTERWRSQANLQTTLALLDDPEFVGTLAIEGLIAAKALFLNTLARHAHLGREEALRSALAVIPQSRAMAFVSWLDAPPNALAVRIQNATRTIARNAESVREAGGSDRLRREAEAQLTNGRFLDAFEGLTGPQHTEFLRVYVMNAGLGAAEASRRASLAAWSVRN